MSEKCVIRLLYYLPMERMKLERKNKNLKESLDIERRGHLQLARRVKQLEEENKKLKSDLANIQCEFGFECDECEYWKREMKKHKPCLIKEEYVFNLGDYDYIILTSTTPQLKIIKKNQNYSLMEEDTLQELRDLGEI